MKAPDGRDVIRPQEYEVFYLEFGVISRTDEVLIRELGRVNCSLNKLLEFIQMILIMTQFQLLDISTAPNLES